MKLLVSAVLLAAVLPPAMTAFSSIREQHQVAMFESELENLIKTAQWVSMGGAGTTGEAVVEVPSFVEKVVFGSKEGPSCLVKVVFSGGTEKRYLISDPMVYMEGGTGGVFVVVGGTAAHVVLRNTGFVDVDGDGFMDSVICISRPASGG